MSMFWTTAYGLQKEKAEVGLPTMKETELTTIHEAFQVNLNLYLFCHEKPKNPQILQNEQQFLSRRGL